MSRGYCSGCLQPAVCEARGGCQGPSPHTDPGALLKLAAEIERACKAPNYEARLGTIEGKTVVAILRQAASHGSAGAAQGSKGQIAFINARLEDLAESNAIYGKDQRLGAPGKIARNDREISWLKDLRSMIVLASSVPSAHREAGK